MEQILINKGIIHVKEFDQKLIFRQMLDMPIGLSYLYLVDKTTQMVELEMKVLNNGDRNAPVYYSSVNKAWPIWWEDDMPEIPVSALNVFEMIITGTAELVSVDEEFNATHVELFDIYERAYRKIGNNGTDKT